MINVDKVRLWKVRFVRAIQFKEMPYPSIVVEEVEEQGYRIPQVPHRSIPLEIGGQITVTLEGKGVLQVGEKKFDCLPGTAFLYRHSDPSVTYYFPRNGREKWRFVWINFMGEASGRIISEINATYGYHFHVGGQSRLEKRLMSYSKYAGATFSQSPLEAAQMVFEMLQSLCQPLERQFDLPRKSRQVRDLQSEIQNAFNESLTTATLAKKLGITREHLSKTFRAKTGRTFQDYREEQRLNEALTLLLKSNLSCKEIAVLCHYGSYSSFFRSFKKHYSVSPEVFREKHQ